MSWKNWPSWLKGGLIGLCVAVVYLIISFLIPPLRIGLLFIIIPVIKLISNLSESLLKPLGIYVELLILVVSGILIIFIGFIVGSIVGFIISKFKEHRK